MEKNINNITIYNSIILAAQKISKNKQHLNEVNFFPVPDNDTGTNLAHLMQRIRRDIELKEDIKEMLKLVSDSAVIGSRGNSGAIFSQFLQGFEEKCPNKSSLEVSELIDCFDSGKTYAYKALNNPMEGTILTAIASFSDSLKKLKNKEMSLEEIFSKSYNTLETTVKNTKYMLKSQVKTQREDAGALGFMYFVQGFLLGILGENSEAICKQEDEILEYSLTETNEEHVVDKYQFCTEILSKKSTPIEKAHLQNILEKYGNSMVITENKTYRRVHIHTNSPADLVETLGNMDEILEVKADDMILQQRLLRKSDSEIGLVIDSIADFPIDNLPDFVYMLPLTIIANGVSYQDKRTLPKSLLESKNLSSSQPNREEIKNFLDPIFKRHKHVVVLTVSSKMSGLYDRYAEFKEDYPNLSLSIIDSKLNSVAEGLVVLDAIKKIQEGLGLKELLKTIDKSIKDTYILVSLKNLKAMIRSGRLNQKIGWILQKLGFLPLVTINSKGQGTIKNKAFTEKQNFAILIKEIEKNKDKIKSYALVHANNLEKSKNLEKQLKEILGFPPMYISEISSIVENYSGDGSVAIGYQLKENYE